MCSGRSSPCSEPGAAPVDAAKAARHLLAMPSYEFRWPPRQRRVIDMTPDGAFRDAPRLPLSTRVLVGAVLVAVVAGAIAVAALALYVALALIPVALGAAAIAYGLYRFRLWRARRSFGGARDVFRP